MKRVTIALILSLVSCVIAQAQFNKDELANITKALEETISKEMPGWTHRSIQPIEGSEGVIIQHWEIGDIAVNIAVSKWRTEELAVRAFKEFKSNLRIEEQATSRSRGKQVHLIKEDLSTLGDEGYVSDVRGSEAVAFRKGKFIVNVSVPRPDGNKDVFFSRKFAAHVASVLQLQ